MFRLLLVIPALALTGCTVSRGGNEQREDSDSNTVSSLQLGNGQVTISGPGFSGNFQGPSLRPSADEFEMNGVHLYPGSTLDDLRVSTNGDDTGSVRVAFTSPASATTVRDWLKERLGKASYTLSTAGNGLSGKTDEGKPFKLELNDDGAGKSKGTIEMGG